MDIDCVFRMSPKRFDGQVLLNPFKKKSVSATCFGKVSLFQAQKACHYLTEKKGEYLFRHHSIPQASAVGIKFSGLISVEYDGLITSESRLRINVEIAFDDCVIHCNLCS